MNCTFTKIRRNDKRVELHYQLETDEGEKELYRLRCQEEPTEAFDRALQDCIIAAHKIVKLPEDYDENATVTGVQISHTDEGRKVSFSIKKTFTEYNEPFTYTTPHTLLLVEEEPLLDALEEAAKAYLDGDRKQKELFAAANGSA